MLIAYRPDLENPPREGGFGIITEMGLIQLSPGVNTDVPDTKWELARKHGAIKRLMAIGAIEEVKQTATVQEIPESIDTLIQLPLTEAFRLLEIMHDEDQLQQWKGHEGRVRIRSAISKRLTALKEGRV